MTFHDMDGNSKESPPEVVTHRCGTSILKDEIIYPKFYIPILKIQLKRDTDHNLSNFHNHIIFSLDARTKLKEYILPLCEVITGNIHFSDNFIPYFDHPYYTYNDRDFTSGVFPK